MSLYVDTRYQGHHGIARYAREVLPRLTVAWEPLPAQGEPTSPRSVAHRGWRTPGGADTIYSPGFGTGLSKARQLLTVMDLIHFRNSGPKARLQRQYYERLVRPAIRRSGHVFTISPASADEIREWIRDDSVQIHDTACGCDPAFRPDGPSHDHPRPYLLYVGNAKAHKNAVAAMRALRRLTDFDLIAVTGDGDVIRGLAAANQVADRVHIVSGIHDDTLAAYYRGAAALVFPSLVEGFGLPPLESMKCGTNVVYSASAASVAQVCGDTQFPVADPTNPSEFADRILDAVSTPFIAPPHLDRYEWARVARVVDDVLNAVAR